HFSKIYRKRIKSHVKKEHVTGLSCIRDCKVELLQIMSRIIENQVEFFCRMIYDIRNGII
ncbi:MAG: hypothetical protein NC429_15490, partial [Lachnospiraceae bacterium]|nr:hypothetical protein [Lachnospiraceae bacterium]